MFPWLSPSTIKAYRYGQRPLQPDVASAMAEIMRAEIERGQAILAELEAIASKPRVRVPRGFELMRDRDGSGVLRDGRPVRGKRV